MAATVINYIENITNVQCHPLIKMGIHMQKYRKNKNERQKYNKKEIESYFPYKESTDH